MNGASGVEGADVDGHVAGRHLEPQQIGTGVYETKLRVAPGADEGASTHLQLEMAVVADVQLVAGSHRRVDLGRRPIVRPGSPERYVTLGEAETSRRPVALHVLGACGGTPRTTGDGKNYSKGQDPSQRLHHFLGRIRSVENSL